MTKTLKPLTNSSRNAVLINYREKLVPYEGKIPRKISRTIKKCSGRNNQGRITVRHQGGGHKNFCYSIDFKRRKNDGVKGKVKSIDYGLNRSNSFTSLISYENGDYNLIIAPEGLKVGDKIISGEDESVPIQIGNNLPLRYIPKGTPIHNLESKPQEGGKLLRSAGTYGEITGEVWKKGKEYRSVKLSSKEIKLFLPNCRATIGKVSNSEANQVKLGKAGRARWRGERPENRGVSMNARDHPHGGGEGKAPIGHPSPLSPWGKKTLGKKTRKKNKPSNKYIIQRRKK